VSAVSTLLSRVFPKNELSKQIDHVIQDFPRSLRVWLDQHSNCIHFMRIIISCCQAAEGVRARVYSLAQRWYIYFNTAVTCQITSARMGFLVGTSSLKCQPCNTTKRLGVAHKKSRAGNGTGFHGARSNFDLALCF